MTSAGRRQERRRCDRLTDERVTGRVPMMIIDLLESVQVDEQHGQRLAPPLEARECARRPGGRPGGTRRLSAGRAERWPAAARTCRKELLRSARPRVAVASLSESAAWRGAI